MVSPNQIRAALQHHDQVFVPALPGRTNHLKSAILIPLWWDQKEPTAILTLRPDSLRQHPGEVCFPGGRPDLGDVDLCATALREAHEELGITDPTILGELSSIPLYTSDYRLTPFVAELSSERFVVNEDEVAEVLFLPLRQVFEQPSIEGLPWSSADASGLSPLFRIDERIVFGGTAYAFLELLTVCAPLFNTRLPPLEPGALGWGDVLPKGTKPPS